MYSSKHLIFALGVISLLSACVGTPHKQPTEVTTLEVSVYKAGIKKGCVDAGGRKGDDPTKTSNFCSCVVQTLEHEMSEPEWQSATFYSQQRQGSLEQGVIAPYMAKVQACRAK